ncbi:adenylate cyclase [Vibrio splendidus ZS-139]|nr:adenylate cyclase [Vibrio splendidus ZS-139]
MTNDHFKGKYEVELKYRLSSKSEFLKTLNLIPHEVMLQDNLECDWYFDSPDRCEATNITDATNAKSMLENLGYEVILKAQKTRSIYFVGEFHITVDSLAGIGDFAEFAIMTNDESKLSAYKDELELLASQFGLSQSALQTKSYKQMFEEILA